MICLMCIKEICLAWILIPLLYPFTTDKLLRRLIFNSFDFQWTSYMRFRNFIKLNRKIRVGLKHWTLSGLFGFKRQRICGKHLLLNFQSLIDDSVCESASELNWIDWNLMWVDQSCPLFMLTLFSNLNFSLILNALNAFCE